MSNTASYRENATRLDHATLRGQVAGSHTRYTVAFRGPADEGWARAYRDILEESGAHRGFELNLVSRTIAFSCLTVEGPTMVFEMLERLEELLGLVDARIEAWRAAGALATAPPGRSIVVQ